MLEDQIDKNYEFTKNFLQNSKQDKFSESKGYVDTNVFNRRE